MRVYRGVKNKTTFGKENPYVVTGSFSYIWPWQVEEVVGWDESEKPVAPIIGKRYQLGELPSLLGPSLKNRPNEQRE